MANILGTLFVNVTANTADFIGGLDKASFAARRAGRDIESSFSRLGDVAARALAPLGQMGQQIATTLENVGDAAGKAMASLGAFAAVGVGAGVAAAGLGTALIAAASHAAELGSQIFEASEKTGLTAANLSGLMALSKETGGSFEALTTTLARATANLAKTAESGGKANSVLFQLMGGAQGAAELGLKPMDDRIQIILKRIFDLSDAGERNLALTQLLGRGWQQNIETLRLLAEQGYGPAIEQAKKFGIYFDADKARQAKEFQIAMDQLQASISALSLVIGTEAIPWFTKWAAIIAGLGPGLAAVGYRMKAVWDLLTVNIAGWRADMAAADVKTRESVQAQTDFLVKIHSLAEGHKVAGTALQGHTDKLREHKDALDRAAEASRNFWEKFNAGVAEAQAKIPTVVKGIADLANAATEAAAQGYTASLAVDKYREALDNLMRAGTAGAIARGLPPAVGAPGEALPGALATLMPSSESMRRIAAAPPTVFDVRQIAAFREEQRRMDEEWNQAAMRVGDLRTQFTGFFNELRIQGEDLGPKVFGSLLRAIDDVSKQLARLVVTGKADFKQLLEGLETNVMEAGFQRGIGKISEKLAGALGIKLPGAGKQLGDSPSNPLYTSDVNKDGGVGGGIDFSGDSSDTSGGLTGFFKKIGGLFGGGRAVGGPVVPGRAYMVGEHGPEMFMPHASGAIAPVAATPGHTTILNFNVQGVSDYDSFRRSQSQIMAGLQHQLSTAYSRQQG
jgi:hypothetical protein